jgi:hypothetical protein
MAVVMAVAWLAQAANAQQRTSVQSATFTAPDGAFRFSYPSDFQVCTQGRIQPCIQSFIPVCEQDALVCLVYPAEELKDTSFSAASFQVREIFDNAEQMTADICATPKPRDHGSVTQYPEFLISAEHPVEMIGGRQFLHAVKDGVATGHSIAIDLYRTFHRQRCFELSVSTTGTDPNISDPPMKTLSPAQRRKLDQMMSRILHSFSFTN